MKYSKQREQILNFVKSDKTHPTAEIVYNQLRINNPNISLGTVYRNLDILSELGEIKRIRISEGKDRFDGDIGIHYHAICLECGEVYNLNIEDFSKVDRIVEDKLDCKVISHKIIFYIICSNCK